MLSGLNLSGEKVALVGGFSSPSRDDIKSLITARGGKCRGGGIAADTTLVVVGDCTEHNQKVRSARAMGIKLIDLDVFVKCIDDNSIVMLAEDSVKVEVQPITPTSVPTAADGRFSAEQITELIDVLQDHTTGAEITIGYALSLLESKGAVKLTGDIQVNTRKDFKTIESKIRDLKVAVGRSRVVS